jgi:hypothetical protein
MCGHPGRWFGHGHGGESWPCVVREGYGRSPSGRSGCRSVHLSGVRLVGVYMAEMGCWSVAAVVALVHTWDGLFIHCTSRWPRPMSNGCTKCYCGTIGGTVLPGPYSTLVGCCVRGQTDGGHGIGVLPWHDSESIADYLVWKGTPSLPIHRPPPRTHHSDQSSRTRSSPSAGADHLPLHPPSITISSNQSYSRLTPTPHQDSTTRLHRFPLV